MRIGIYGGTFDPVHYGHLILAEQCREQCGLDEVWLLPAGQPPHKQSDSITDGQLRAEMLDLATAGHPYLRVDRRELQQTGLGYTWQTLQAIHEENRNHELFFLMGADSLHDLPGWKTPQRILQLAVIIAVNRGDTPADQMQTWQAQLGDAASQRIRLVTMPAVDISSTDLRERVRTGCSIRYLIPRPVEEFIRQHKLYS